MSLFNSTQQHAMNSNLLLFLKLNKVLGPPVFMSYLKCVKYMCKAVSISFPLQ